MSQRHDFKLPEMRFNGLIWTFFSSFAQICWIIACYEPIISGYNTKNAKMLNILWTLYARVYAGNNIKSRLSVLFCTIRKSIEKKM